MDFARNLSLECQGELLTGRALTMELAKKSRKGSAREASAGEVPCSMLLYKDA